MSLYQPTKLDKNDNFNIQYHLTKLRKEIDNDVSIKEYNIKSINKNNINLIVFNNPHTLNHLLICHGNAGNIKDMINTFYLFGKYTSITIFDYQGYGKSEGSPSEINCYNDAYSVWKFLVKDIKIIPKNITIYGISLGGAIATNLTNRVCNDVPSDKVNPHSLIIQSSFSNFKNLVSDLCSNFLSNFVYHKFDSHENVKQIGNKTKILISHSPNDELINIYHSKLLFENCKKHNSHFHQINGSHNTTQYDDKYINKIIEHLRH